MTKLKSILLNMRIRTKMILGFGSIILMSAIIIITAIKNIVVVADNTEKLYNNSQATVDIMWSIRADMLSIQKSMYESILATDSAERQKFIDENTKSVENVKSSIETLRNNFKLESEISILNEFESTLKQGTPIRNQINQYIVDGQNLKATDLVKNQYEPMYEKSNDIVLKLFEIVNQDSQNFVKTSKNIKNMVIISITVMLLIGVAIAIFISYAITISLTKHIKEIADVAEEVSNGNLNIELEYKSNNELGHLAHSMRSTVRCMKTYINNIDDVLDKMSEGDMDVSVDIEYRGDFKRIKESILKISNSLNEALTQIDNASEYVKKSSEKVANTSEILSQGAIEQASVVEQFTASIQEITDSINKNTEYIEITNKKSSISKSTAMEGNESMKKMLKAIDEIDKSSKNIADIIKIIDDIANQTNLLALNANIEAARAGDAGKGFAIVADEVRELADQSSEAVKNISETIQKSIERVNQGKEISRDTSNKLEEIVKSTEETAELSNTILEISERQKTCLLDIQHGTEQVGNLVNTNSTTSEENSIVSQELSQQADRLHDLISQFKLKHTQDYQN